MTESTIRDRTATFVQAFNAADLDALLDVLGADYLDLRHALEPLSGAQLRATWEGAIAQGATLTVEPRHVLADGALAVSAGELTMELEGGDTYRARYMEVWRKDGDAWRSVWGAHLPVAP